MYEEKRSRSVGPEYVNQAPAYELFKVNPKGPIWLGSMNDLPKALDQMKRMAARLPGHYFVCDSGSREVIASVHSGDSLA